MESSKAPIGAKVGLGEYCAFLGGAVLYGIGLQC